jgi:hypothetical protein
MLGYNQGMAEIPEDIILKIKKLQALANNGATDAEAELAVVRVSQPYGAQEALEDALEDGDGDKR